MKPIVIILFLSSVLLGVGCTSTPSSMSQTITLTTTDGVEIVGTYRNTGQDKIAILLHMMPATKESWDSIAAQLLDRGYASLAIDLRGHGESAMGGRLNYKSFSDEEHQASQRDVEAALAWAMDQTFSEDHIILMGASIGANLAIQAMKEHPAIALAVALSPGLDYHGVKTEGSVQGLSAPQKILLVASDDDTYSWDSVRALHDLNPSQTVLIERSGIGHGTTMTDKDASLIEEIFSHL